MDQKNKLMNHEEWKLEADMQDQISELQNNFYEATNSATYIDYSESSIKLSEENLGAVDVSSGGSLRFNEGKPQFSHLSPSFVLEMMKTMTTSNKKYPYLNYTKKQNVRTASDSLMRHFLSFQDGADIDSESLCHHLAHVAVNAMIMFENLQDYGDEVDDRYAKYKAKVQND